MCTGGTEECPRLQKGSGPSIFWEILMRLQKFKAVAMSSKAGMLIVFLLITGTSKGYGTVVEKQESE